MEKIQIGTTIIAIVGYSIIAATVDGMWWMWFFAAAMVAGLILLLRAYALRRRV